MRLYGIVDPFVKLSRVPGGFAIRTASWGPDDKTGG